MGIETRVKDLQIFHSGSKKADWDVGIALDAYEAAQECDTLILLSGDGDFERALELLRSRGKRICVVSTQNWIASELRMAVGSHYIDLQDLRSQIERTERPREMENEIHNDTIHDEA